MVGNHKLHVPSTLDVSGQWWEIVLQWMAHLCTLVLYYQTYLSVSPVQSCGKLHMKHWLPLVLSSVDKTDPMLWKFRTLVLTLSHLLSAPSLPCCNLWSGLNCSFGISYGTLLFECPAYCIKVILLPTCCKPVSKRIASSWLCVVYKCWHLLRVMNLSVCKLLKFVLLFLAPSKIICCLHVWQYCFVHFYSFHPCKDLLICYVSSFFNVINPLILSVVIISLLMPFTFVSIPLLRKVTLSFAFQLVFTVLGNLMFLSTQIAVF